LQRSEAITLKAQGPACEMALPQLAWSLRGRQASFLAANLGGELQLRAAMTSGSSKMRVAPIAPLAAYVGTKDFMIRCPARCGFGQSPPPWRMAFDHRLDICHSSLG